MNINIKEVALEGEFLAIDVEGDGNATSLPVAFAAIHFRNGEPIRQFFTFINPGRPISPFVTNNIHGITDEMVKCAPSVTDFISMLPTHAPTHLPWVGHSIRNDIEMLTNGDTTFPIPNVMFDTVRLFKWAYPDTEKTSLLTVAQTLGLLPEGTTSLRHDPVEDALIAGRALTTIAQLIPTKPKQVAHLSNSFRFRVPRKMQMRIDEANDADAETSPKP